MSMMKVLGTLFLIAIVNTSVWTFVSIVDARLTRLECAANLTPKAFHRPDNTSCVKADNYLSSWPFGRRLKGAP